MPKVNGFKQALEMLSKLDIDSSEKILNLMAKQDPQMVEALRKSLVTIEDMQYISQKMLVEFLREINIKDLALSLRIATPTLSKYILENTSSGIGKDIREVLNGPAQPRSLVNESLEKVMQVFRDKVAKKEIIIDKNNEEVV